MTRIPVPSLALAALLGLSACATVAANAPALLPQSVIDARTQGAADPSRAQASSAALNARAASLRARAQQMRYQGLSSADYAEMRRRALALDEQATDAQAGSN